MNVLQYFDVIKDFFLLYGEKDGFQIIKTLNFFKKEINDATTTIEFWQVTVSKITNLPYNEIVNNVNVKHCLFYFLHKKLSIPLKVIAKQYGMTKRGVAYAVTNFDQLLSACMENSFIYEKNKNTIIIYHKLSSFLENINHEQNIN